MTNTNDYLLVAVLALAGISSAVAVPFVPTNDEQVIERLPTSTNPIAVELRRLRGQLLADPQNLEFAIRLARRYVALGRAESDPRYYGYAQGVLQPWWDQPEPPPEVLLLRATLRQNRHDFDGALADLGQLLALDPRNVQAWLTQAVVRQVRGEYLEAKRSCLPLMTLADRLSAITCLGNVAGLNGQAAPSYELLRRSLEASPSGDAEVRRWGLTTLAELAVRLGKAQEAERHFQAALALGQRDAYLLAAYADLLLDQDRSKEVVTLLKDGTRVDGLLLRLTLAEQRLGAVEFDAHLASLRARFEASRLRREALHQGEEARFTLQLLQQPAAALRLAQANWAVQREPRDARVLLEAAIATQDRDAAAPVLALLRTAWREDQPLTRLAAQLNQE